MSGIHLSKRFLIRIISYVTAIIFVLLAWGLVNKNLNTAYRTQIQNNYANSMNDLSSYLSDINVTLEKEMYSGSPLQMAILSAQLWKESGSAKVCLNQLPVTSEQSAAIYKFLSQVGDYSIALSRKLGTGQEITNTERQSLSELKNYAKQLSDKFNDINAMMSEGNYWSNEVKYAINTASDSTNLSQLYQSVQDVTQTVKSYPTLIYDGPFSDHIDQQTPQFIKGKSTVTREVARKVAADYLKCNAVDLKDSADEASAIKAYVFTRDDDIIAISKQGGYCLYLNKYRVVGAGSVTEQNAISIAKKYIESKLDMKFAESYFFTTENICVVNFAYLLDDNTACYSDLIKVGVALDTGEIMSVEARGFIMNHRNRTLTTPTYSITKAQSMLSSLLTVENVNSAIINSGGLTEYLCYEFVCKGQNDEDILVYVNVDTLQEESILILLKTDGGTMTR